MKKEQYEELRKLFLIGIVFSLITVIFGEMPIGWTVLPESDDYITSALLGYANIGVVQLAFVAFFGGNAIPFSVYPLGTNSDAGGKVTQLKK